jgi:hypothetical protein
MDTSEKIHYIIRQRNWKQKELGDRLGMDQWEVSRLQLGKQKASSDQGCRIDQVCFETIRFAFNSPSGFRYICNLGEKYGRHFKTRAEDALDRLKSTLLQECPSPSSGLLNIVVFAAVLPRGVRAQCFSTDEESPSSFIILVRAEPDWLASVKDEVFAHVFPIKSSPIEVKEN